MALDWKPINDYAERAGTFQISAAQVAGKWRFVLWHGDEIVTVKDRAREAKEAAETLHAAGAR